jgi:hypothetical protein
LRRRELEFIRDKGAEASGVKHRAQTNHLLPRQVEPLHTNCVRISTGLDTTKPMASLRSLADLMLSASARTAPRCVDEIRRDSSGLHALP